MAPYKLIISYDGTHYLGYQRQGDQKTVQLELERALQVLGWKGRSTLAAGRTDSGVHARAQVVLADLDWRHSPQSLVMALNANLPADIAVQEVQPADAKFHPRYSAIARTYTYRIYCQQARDPMRDRYAWRVWPAVRLNSLNRIAARLIGVHDFAAFGKPPKAGGRTDRIIGESHWRSVKPGELEYRITGNSFLYHMVRRITAVQVAVAQGAVAEEQLDGWLNANGEQVQFLAPPNGLVLVNVWYEDQMDPEKAGLYKVESGEDDSGKDICH